MNNRLTIQDMAGLLADHTGKDKKETERFLREFVAAVMEGVFTDQLVKIKGLGAFKLILVEKRESIHVNTGERFLIPEHYKFSFLPDKELKDLVNKPFSFFETTELGEGVDFSDMDLPEEDESGKEAEDESTEEILPEEKPVEYEESAIEVVPLKEEIKEEEPEAEVQAERPFLEAVYDDYESGRRSPLKRMIIALFTIVLISLVGVYVFFDFKPFLAYNFGSNATFATDTDSTDWSGADLTDLSEADYNNETPDPVPADTVAKQVAVAEDQLAKPEQTIAEQPAKTELAKIKIKTGDRLTLIALEHYGSKLFWVYLYEHNKSVIKDPNNVPVGTEIIIPTPELYGIDAHNRTSLDKAAALQTQILSGKD